MTILYVVCMAQCGMVWRIYLVCVSGSHTAPWSGLHQCERESRYGVGGWSKHILPRFLATMTGEQLKIYALQSFSSLRLNLKLDSLNVQFMPGPFSSVGGFTDNWKIECGLGLFYIFVRLSGSYVAFYVVSHFFTFSSIERFICCD